MAIARRLFGARYSAWAGLLLLTSVRFADLAQRAQLDVLLTACELTAWWAWLRGATGEWPRARALACTHLALGAALLVKGPVGLLPLVGLVVFCGFERRWPELRQLLAPRWLVLSLGPLLAWGGAALTLAPPGFFEEAVVDNLGRRVLSGTSHVRPFYYYVYQLPLEFLPGALLVPWAVWAAWRARRGTSSRASGWRLIAAWTLTFLVVLSLSAGKRGLYMTPALPALAIGCAVALVDGLSRAKRLPFATGWLLAAGGVLLSCFGVAGALQIGPLPEVPPTVDIPQTFWLGVTVIPMAALCGAAALRRRPALQRAAVCGGALVALQAWIFLQLYPALDPERSLRPVAEAAVALARPGERIGVVHHRSLIPGLTYYSGGVPGRYEDLPDHAAIREFLRAGRGQVLISEIRRGWALEPAPFDPVARFRSGKREIKVLAPRGRSANRSRAANDAQEPGQRP